MFQDIEIFHKCIKNVVGKNGLLEKLLVKKFLKM